jgi:hypothetical protein
MANPSYASTFGQFANFSTDKSDLAAFRGGCSVVLETESSLPTLTSFDKSDLAVFQGGCSVV